jgi:nucleoside-diphosphate-sugar epimerase
VVGAASFLGAHLVRALVSRRITTRAAVRRHGTPHRLSDLIQDADVHDLDVRDRASVLHVFGEARPSHVINLARYGVDGSAADRVRMMETNVGGTGWLLEAAIAAGCRRFVHIGSPLEYGPSDRPLDEAEPPAPRTLFGATKACSTLLCLAAARSGMLATCVLRPFMVYGPRDKPGRLVPTAIRAALGDRPLPLARGKSRRDWVFVDDVVAACLLALGGGADGEVVNVGTGRESSNEDVVRLVEEAAARRIDVRNHSMAPRPWDGKPLVASTAKAKSLLGFEAETTLAEGIQRTVGWTRERARHMRPPIAAQR